MVKIYANREIYLIEGQCEKHGGHGLECKWSYNDTCLSRDSEAYSSIQFSENPNVVSLVEGDAREKLLFELQQKGWHYSDCNWVRPNG